MLFCSEAPLSFSTNRMKSVAVTKPSCETALRFAYAAALSIRLQLRTMTRVFMDQLAKSLLKKVFISSHEALSAASL